MFEDDDDFEIDEEFLGGVFDAEQSATICDEALSTHSSSSNNLDLESSPLRKRRTLECSSPSPIPEQHISARRTSEESARLVASAIQRSAASGSNSHGNIPTSDQCYERGDGSNRPAGDFFKPPLAPNPRNHSSERRVSNSNVGSEVSFTLNTSRVRQRKFPGPAGLLPERDRSHMQGQRSNFSSLLNTSGSDLEESEEPLSFCSQSTASVLEDGPWAALQCDLSGEGQGLLRRFTVSWVKQKAAARQLVGQKVPFLAAVLHSIDCSSPDPCVVLRDATGEIPGTLHRSVWDSFGGQLVAGSALVLRLVGVLSTGISARRHYLNITSNNIVTIYSSPLCESSMPNTSNRVKKTDVHMWTINQLLQTANSWEDQSKKKKDLNVNARTVNTFSTNTMNDRLDCASSRPSLQISNRSANVLSTASGSNAGVTLNRAPTSFRHPGQPSRANFAPGVYHSNLDHHNNNQQNNNSSIIGPPMTAFDRSLAHRTNSSPSNFNASQQPSTSKSTSSTFAPQSKFVLKKPSFPAGGIPQSNTPQQVIPQPVKSNTSNQTVNNSQASSKDMFSDDDLDISSVLDGIDSESLFGDF